jgi:hypothetical protein
MRDWLNMLDGKALRVNSLLSAPFNHLTFSTGLSKWIRPLKCFARCNKSLFTGYVACTGLSRIGGHLTQGVAALCPGLSYYRPFRTCGRSPIENYQTKPSARCANSRFRFAGPSPPSPRRGKLIPKLGDPIPPLPSTPVLGTVRGTFLETLNWS